MKGNVVKNTEIQKLVAAYAASGGEVQVLKPSRKKVKTFRGRSGAWAKGAKKINLQDKFFEI
jgi:hypothetical protein